MSYIEYSEYTNVKCMEAISKSEFEDYALFAKDIVDAYTFGVIESMALAEDEHYRPRIVRAMAQIIDAIARSGVNAVLDAKAGEISSKSESIGSYSYSVSYQNGSQESIYGIEIPSLAKMLLAPIKAMGRIR